MGGSLCRYPYQVMEIFNTFATDAAKAEIDKVDSFFFSPPFSRLGLAQCPQSSSAAYEYANSSSCRGQKVNLLNGFRSEKSKSFL